MSTMQRVSALALLFLASAAFTGAASEEPAAPGLQAPSAQAGANKNDTKLSGDKQVYMTKGPDNGHPASVHDYTDYGRHDRPYKDDYEGPFGSPDRPQQNGGGVINLKFQERFTTPTDPLECPGTFPLPEGRNCTDAEVDVVCNPVDVYYKSSPFGHKQHKSPGLLIDDAPKNMAIGIMKTVSATSKADSWSQVKIGKQNGYEVGRIAGEITFDEGAGVCDARLAGAKATFTDVPVYAMITKTSKPVTPSTIESFQAYAKEFSAPPICDPNVDPNCVRHTQPGTSSSQLDVATTAASDAIRVRTELDNVARLRDLAQTDFNRLRDSKDGIQGGEQLLSQLESAATEILDGLTTFCGVTFVARGDVEVTKGANKYTGIFESTLVWDTSGVVVPHFLLTTPPFNSRPTQVTDGGFFPGAAGLISSLVDLLELTLMCIGPDRDTVPLSDPGSIKLALNA